MSVSLEATVVIGRRDQETMVECNGRRHANRKQRIRKGEREEGKGR
jgi:hypothetical protein